MRASGRVETDELFCYGVWTSLSAQSYEVARAAYREKVDAGPFFGWLSNVIPHYPKTLNLKTQVHVRAETRAAIELEPTDHPLAVEQRNGAPSRLRQLHQPQHGPPRWHHVALIPDRRERLL